ncbi:ATP-binding cassette sub-family C member Sur [Gossypium arboreum]|uniref:ATP-binding cassette sub-family C member Sur n=1 Tax=Gossypium arboreum TaxID=29729 RepID=A0A0B0NQ73_GOSAR|nr:ATP-binding cassette sub-family C member Sur [Gossypium arboreum]
MSTEKTKEEGEMEESLNYGHQHPLLLMLNEDQLMIVANCSRCGEKVSTPCFSCAEGCGFYLHKKHHPPMLGDEVWQLEKIGKDGAFHKKLAYEGVNTVQDFLKMSVVDPPKLRKILGPGMSEKMWEVTIKHAKTCVMGNKYYVFQGTNYRIFLNPICQLVKAEINGTTYPIQTLSSINRSYVEDLVRQAYVNWSSLKEIEGISNEIGLLTQGDDMLDQYRNQQNATMRSFQENAYLTHGSFEGYVPNEMQADCSNWQISQNYFNTPNENGIRLNLWESNSDDDLTSPKSFISGG